jgi:hypothetical protein
MITAEEAANNTNKYYDKPKDIEKHREIGFEKLNDLFYNTIPEYIEKASKNGFDSVSFVLKDLFHYLQHECHMTTNISASTATDVSRALMAFKKTLDEKFTLRSFANNLIISWPSSNDQFCQMTYYVQYKQERNDLEVILL